LDPRLRRSPPDRGYPDATADPCPAVL
jgi:hypothetical protein